MPSRNLSPGRLFRAPPEELQQQADVARRLWRNWTQFARASLNVFTSAKVVEVTRAGRLRKRTRPELNDIRALIIVGEGPPYFLQHKSEEDFEPVQSLPAAFARWELTHQDFEDPKLVKRHLDASPYQGNVKPTKGAK